MFKLQRNQKGVSAVGLIFILAIIGFGAFVGIQYIPQLIEAGTVDSILESIEQSHKTEPVQSENEVWSAINKQLDVNQMHDLRDSFDVSRYRSKYTITVSYERDLDLGFTNVVKKYEKTVTLD